MNNPYEFNTHNLQKLDVLGTSLYIIDDFYKDPDSVLDIIENQSWTKWKEWDDPSYNGVHFLDHRHDFLDDRSKIYNLFFENLTGQKIGQPGRIVTNCMRFYDKEFNDYENYYWGPHSDLGYTGLVYLNKFDSEGTNFYRRTKDDPWDTPEHFEPWRSKDRYQLECMIPAKYNRLVLFDGECVCHGMAVDSDRFFSTTRINQAIFLR